VLRPRLSKPIGRERDPEITGVDEATQRPLDAEPVQSLLLRLPAIAVTQLGTEIADEATGDCEHCVIARQGLAPVFVPVSK